MKNEDKSDIFHSSTYGRSQNGGSMGSAFASGPRPAQYVKPAANTGAQPASRPAPQRPLMPRNPGIHLK